MSTRIENATEEDLIEVPSIEIVFYPEMVLSGKSWNEAQEEIPYLTIGEIDKNFFMLTPYQFRETLRELRGSEEHEDLYEEIIGGEFSAYHLNAQFGRRKGDLWMYTENVLGGGEYTSIGRKLGDVLMEDRYDRDGISRDGWLDSREGHGLPPRDILDGNLEYFFPRQDCVAGFVAGSFRAYLDCVRHPSDSSSSLGVLVGAEGTSHSEKER